MIIVEYFLAIWWIGLGYLLGSIPFGLIVSKFFGEGDIRKVGSGNIGTTNVLRTGNKFAAAVTLLCDLLKGLLPVVLVLGTDLELEYLPYVVGLATMLGHIFPVWLKFKGGKGVATGVGVFLALNFWVGALLIATWILVAKFWNISSLSALIGYALAPVAGWFFGGWTLCIFALIIAAIIFWTHQDNLRRLIKGEEGGMSF